MNDFTVSDALLESAYRIIFRSACETEKDRAVFAAICQSCDKNGISVQKYLTVLSEVSEKIKELEECE